jgi:hypothetical protein
LPSSSASSEPPSTEFASADRSIGRELRAQSIEEKRPDRAFVLCVQPTVAGFLAMLEENDPTLKPDQIIDVLKRASIELGDQGRHPVFHGFTLSYTLSGTMIRLAAMGLTAACGDSFVS